jgi:4-hydroxy-3-methylbut-2-enyl diphosphate reductase
MEVILARPRGFCKGVVRAVDMVEQLLTSHGAPVYVLHEIVHNRHVVENLNERGALFVETVEDVPPGALVIFSAHGVSDAVARRAKQRRLRIIDATCPLVKKVHFRARRYGRRGLEVIIIGHKGHPEVEGTMGCVSGPLHVVSTLAEAEALRVGDPTALAYVTQTTLNIKGASDIIAHLKGRFPGIKGPALADICYATQSRQRAVHRLASEVDLLLVVGSRNSSNSNRLREVGEQTGCPSYLIEDARDMDPAWFTTKNSVGVTAGASAPEVLVEGVVEKLQSLAIIRVREMDSGFEETFTQEWGAVLSRRQGVEATSDHSHLNAL